MNTRLLAFLALLSHKAGPLPLSALLLLSAGVLWFWISGGLFLLLRKRKGTSDAGGAALPFWCFFPTFVCTVLGGVFLVLFCTSPVLAAGILLGTALLNALPPLLAGAHRPGGDKPS